MKNGTTKLQNARRTSEDNYLAFPRCLFKQGDWNVPPLSLAPLSRMASEQCSVNFPILSQDNITSTEAVMSITTVNTPKQSFLRAVLNVKGEKRRWGTRHCSALESAKKLLSRFAGRISAATKKGVLGMLQRAVRPRKHGVQPRKKSVGILQRAVRPRGKPQIAKVIGQGKIGVQTSLLSKKRSILAQPVAKTNDPVSKPAPLCLFLHGSGGKEDGSELSKDQKKTNRQQADQTKQTTFRLEVVQLRTWQQQQ